MWHTKANGRSHPERTRTYRYYFKGLLKTKQQRSWILLQLSLAYSTCSNSLVHPIRLCKLPYSNCLVANTATMEHVQRSPIFTSSSNNRQGRIWFSYRYIFWHLTRQRVEVTHKASNNGNVTLAPYPIRLLSDKVLHPLVLFFKLSMGYINVNPFWDSACATDTVSVVMWA